MQITPIKIDEKVYIEWNISDTVKMNGSDGGRVNYPYVIRSLMTAKDARMYAQMLLDAAHAADDVQAGGRGFPPGFNPPPPPPPPPKK